MDLNSSATKWLHIQAGGFAAGGHAWHGWWQHLPATVHSPVWPRILVTLLILGLLLAFHQVVSGAVQQGELRRKAVAMQAEATGRCHRLPGSSARDNCLLQLNALALADAMLLAPNMAKLAPIE